MGAMLGVQAFWVVVGEVLGVARCWLLMAGRFKRLTDRYDAITIPDYLEGRFRDGSQKLRMVSAAALVIFVTIYVSAQIDATGTAFESFLGVDYMTGALVGFAVVMAYIVSGGFVAVVWSDVFQGTLMFLGLLILPIVGITMIGGVDEMMAGLAAIDPDLTRLSGPGGWSTKRVLEVIGLSLIGLGFLGSPQIFVRLLSLKSDKEIAPGAAVALIWTIVADSGAVVTGMVGRTLLAPAGFRVEMLGNGGQNVLPLLVELALPKHGDVVLGEQYDGPIFSNVSWFGMLFCAGIGSNLLYFGTTEWTGYFLSPPPISGATPGSPLAADWAGAYSFFHWGISAWATYAIATLPIAYVLHVQQSPTLRVSTACDAVLGEHAKGPFGKAIDVLFIFGLIGGIGTSLGIGIPMISAVASDLFGVERGMGLDIAILTGLTAVFSFSVSAGLDKGIKLLSDINVGLAILLLGFIFFAGPTSFIINQAFDSLALMFQNFVEMSLRTDAGSDVSFAQDNTIFFWAWWLAWAPFMGLFVARISGGRTIRQVIVGVVGGGSIGCWAGFSILGHTTMNLAQTGSPAMTAIIDQAKQGGSLDAPQMVVTLLQSMPASTMLSAVFFVLAFIFVATSLDSAAFTLAATASDGLPVEGQPPRWHRLVWAFVLATHGTHAHATGWPSGPPSRIGSGRPPVGGGHGSDGLVLDAPPQWLAKGMRP